MDWPKLMTMLLSGKSVKAEDAVGWLIDATGSMNESLATAWSIVSGTSKIERRAFNDGVLSGLPEPAGLPPVEGPSLEAGRKAILDCVKASCGATLADAITIQAKLSGEFMKTPACKKGRVGTEFSKTMAV